MEITKKTECRHIQAPAGKAGTGHMIVGLDVVIVRQYLKRMLVCISYASESSLGSIVCSHM